MINHTCTAPLSTLPPLSLSSLCSVGEWVVWPFFVGPTKNPKFQSVRTGNSGPPRGGAVVDDVGRAAPIVAFVQTYKYMSKFLSLLLVRFLGGSVSALEWCFSALFILLSAFQTNKRSQHFPPPSGEENLVAGLQEAKTVDHEHTQRPPSSSHSLAPRTRDTNRWVCSPSQPWRITPISRSLALRNRLASPRIVMASHTLRTFPQCQMSQP